MARRIRSSRIIAPSRRLTAWFGLHIGQTTVAASSQVLVASLDAAALATRPFTVVRTRIEMLISSDQAAVTEAVRGAFGMMVVSDQAIGIGTTAIPGPATETDAPWFVYEGFVNKFTFLTSAGFAEPTGTRIIVDSKAMRKVQDNEDIAIMCDNLETVGLDITLAGRMLVKLH